MAKILSQAGNSLADIYDVEGSIAGIETLETRDLPIVHEVGGTVFSERFSQEIFRVSSGSILQATNFNQVITTLPEGAFRIYAVAVFMDITARAEFVSLAVRDQGTGRECPIFAWDVAVDSEIQVRLDNDGAGVGTEFILRQLTPMVQFPQMMTRGQPQSVQALAFRGQSSAFGAGNIEIEAEIHVGFSEPIGLSSRGLPMPSW